MCVCIPNASAKEDLAFGETMKVITKLEEAGEWNKALPLYRDLYSQLRLKLDGLTIPFLFRKGICEMQCSIFDDAEKSFDHITRNTKVFKVPDIYLVTVVRANFYLAEVQARSGKFEAAEKSLATAKLFFEQAVQVNDDAQMRKWRNVIVAKILGIIESGDAK